MDKDTKETGNMNYMDGNVRPAALERITNQAQAEAFIAAQLAALKEQIGSSRVLLALSGGRPLFAATPLGFGEGNVRQRIKSVLRWRKPKCWMALLAVLLLAAVALLFALTWTLGCLCSLSFGPLAGVKASTEQSRAYRVRESCKP